MLATSWLGLGDRARVAWMFGVPAIVCYTFVARPIRFALGLAALLLAGLLYPGPQGRPLLQERTFFGVLRVTLDPAGRFHQLVHGNTIHGRQRRAGDLRDQPLSYYHPTGPAGDVFARLREAGARGAVGVVGLGTGSLCAYAGEGEEWVFYEIDPAVVRLARDPAYFTFWRDCRAARRSVVTGDARLRLAEAADGRYGVLVLDAFSSSAIPLNLLTREALDLYRRKTAAGGWIVFHISSQHLDLEPVVARLARDAGWVAYARDDRRLSAAAREAGKDPSRWAVLAHRRSDLGGLADDLRWRALASRGDAPVWTDDFSNLWDVIRWDVVGPEPLRRRAPPRDWAAPRPHPAAPALPARVTRRARRGSRGLPRDPRALASPVTCGPSSPWARSSSSGSSSSRAGCRPRSRRSPPACSTAPSPSSRPSPTRTRSARGAAAPQGRPASIRLRAIIASVADTTQLIVRNLDPSIVAALRTRAARSGRSMEAEHREILRSVLRPSRRRTSFKEWLARMPAVGLDRDFARRRSRARRVRL